MAKAAIHVQGIMVVNLKQHPAKVKLDESIIALETIKEAIREAGYDAK